ncbi:DUF934 domain-containing protein [Aureimonas mangrovi]|uniref:DUF934 domain-containing protein n=1 Tax=Aureimonas mangrovi TaxID=2758041 RepID=UPI00163D89C4|nr:DUF934 domain-containing protein [Aureimonas mangrovi]
MSALIGAEGALEDEYTPVEAVEDLSLAEGAVLVPLAVIDQAIADRRNARLGLLLPNDVPVSAAEPYLGAVDLIAVAFPSFSDGRGLSIAMRLRRAGFTGRLRARGPLIADQFAEALACGFDEVELPDALAGRQPVAQWLAAKDSVTAHYQTGYGETRSILQQRLDARRG